jgi:ribosomal protein S18 acetylase RimI-like enzyme
MNLDPQTRRTLRRLESNLQLTVARDREQVELGAFRAFVSPVSRAYEMSVAVPLEDREDWASSIRRLDAAFELRSRRSRLEFFDALYPNLGPALETAGYVLDLRAPVMVVDPGLFRPCLSEDAAEYHALGPSNDTLIDVFLTMQARAFHIQLDLSDAGWRPTLVDGLRDGSLMAGVNLVGDAVASGGVLLLAAGSAELAGVGTDPGHRRQGLASDACSRLLSAYFAAGHDLCWLSAGPGAEALYARMGFETVGEQLHYGRVKQ